MGNQQTPLLLSPFSLAPALEECAGSIHLCCLYARDAAERSRFGAAHGLFQSAIFLYDRARQLASKQDDFSFHDASVLAGVGDFLNLAHSELDACALIVYPESVVGELTKPQTVALREL